MKFITSILCITLGINLVVSGGSPRGAERIVKNCRISELEWEQKLLSARTPEERQKCIIHRPDFELYSKLMTDEIGASLDQAWTMPYIIWLLNHHNKITAEEVKRIMSLIKEYHMESPKLGEFCIALAPSGIVQNNTPDAKNAGNQVILTSDKIKFMESIVNDGDKSKPLRGQVCLALSIVLASMGDAPEINGRRLNLIRKAIINSAHMPIGKMTVADIAAEEIYRIKNLSKKAKAPELSGFDSQKRRMKLSDYRGKIVVLVFWNSWENSIQVLDYLRKIEKLFDREKFQIIGVNRDSTADLRKMEMAQKTIGRNFTDPNGDLYKVYRVKESPVCYVLDADGIVRYNGMLGSFVEFTVSALLSGEKK